MADHSSRKSLSQKIDLTPYAGCWVALVRGCVTGVGVSERAARLASKHQRPKEEPIVIFVQEELTKAQGRRANV
jgi:transcriptional regulatory protein LevR